MYRIPEETKAVRIAIAHSASNVLELARRAMESGVRFDEMADWIAAEVGFDDFSEQGEEEHELIDDVATAMDDLAIQYYLGDIDSMYAEEIEQMAV